MRAVRERALPLYGLPAGWEGQRALGGWGGKSKDSGISRVRLRHTIGEGVRAATVEVDTVWNKVGGEVGDIQEEIEYGFDLRDGPEHPPGHLEWMHMRLPVEGVPTDFVVIAGRSGQWGAAGAIGDLVVGVVVVNFAMADVVLEAVTDIEPYILGWQELRRPPKG